MPQTRKYTIDMKLPLVFHEMGIDAQDVLRVAQLPRDMWNRDSAELSSTEYFRLWRAIETLADDPQLPLRLVDAMRPEAFSTPLFAALCCIDLDSALMRLAEYKPLIGPVQMQVEKGPTETKLCLSGLPNGDALPPLFVVAELLFLTQLARLGTRERIVPARALSPVLPDTPAALNTWLGCDIQLGDRIELAFDRLDAERPFLTANKEMFSAFEPHLQKRLSEVAGPSTMGDRLKAWLTEAIPSGRTNLAQAARELGVSTRTLQRRLSEEGHSFQTVLAEVRQGMARHYLARPDLSTAEIAFLLGYAEQNSFYRAFHEWTGQTPDSARAQYVQ